MQTILTTSKHMHNILYINWECDKFSIQTHYEKLQNANFLIFISYCLTKLLVCVFLTQYCGTNDPIAISTYPGMKMRMCPLERCMKVDLYDLPHCTLNVVHR